jgi:Na+-driven multidrug efflux pump
VTNALVVDKAQTLLHIMLWSIVVFGFSGVLTGIMRASGVVLVPTLISILCIALVELPTASILSYRIGLNGVWIAYPAVFSTMLLCQWIYYYFVWRKRPIRRMI